MPQRHNQKKGFSLFEAAIVLAVVGGVIGAIWVAVASVKEQLVINEVNAVIQESSYKIKNSLPISTPDGYLLHLGLGITTAIDMGFFPNTWIPNSPLGTGTTLNIASGLAYITLGNGDGLNQARCMKIVSGLIPALNRGEITAIAIGGSGYTFSRDPATQTPSNIRTGCNNVWKMAIRFYLTRIN